MKNLLLINLLFISSVCAEDFYTVEDIKHPDENVALEVGGMCLAQNGGLMLTIRRGDIWHLSTDGKWTMFAQGLQEPLGIRPGKKPGEYFVIQRPEISRLVDENNDGVADLYESFSRGWGFTANYHEYAMAFTQDKEGNLYGGLGLPFSTKGVFNGKWLASLDVQERGMFFKVDKDGHYSQVASGVREPVGSVFHDNGDLFMTDTQGSFICTNWVIHVEKGDFLGHPEGLLWDKSRPGLADKLLKLPVEERNVEIDKLRKRPVVYLPYRKLGASTGGLTFDTTNGKFGPYAGQMIIAEVIDSMLIRACFEKVDGVYQGAAFKLASNVGRGGLRPVFAPDGSLWLGKTARGWGQGAGLAKINWTGKVPFDIKEIKIMKTGFTVTFTKKVAAFDAATIKLDSFRYQYTNGYNSPAIDKKELPITGATLAADGMSAVLQVDGLAEDTVVHFNYKDLKGAENEVSEYPESWYTLNKLPK